MRDFGLYLGPATVCVHTGYVYGEPSHLAFWGEKEIEWKVGREGGREEERKGRTNERGRQEWKRRGREEAKRGARRGKGNKEEVGEVHRSTLWPSWDAV